MEKKNILKLLALIVLMTVACVGFAMAEHEHDWVSDCNHLDELLQDDWFVEQLARAGIVNSEATCATQGSVIVCCQDCDFEGLGRHYKVDMDGDDYYELAITSIPTGYDHTAHEFETKTTKGEVTTATCDQAAGYYTVCSLCVGVHTEEELKDEGIASISGTQGIYAAKWNETKAKVATNHAGAAGLFEYDADYNEYHTLKAGLKRSELINAGFEVVRAQHDDCAIRSYYEVVCEACKARFKIYTENEPAHIMALNEDAADGTVIKCTSAGEWTLNGEIAHYANVKGDLLLNKKAADCLNAAAEISNCVNCNFTFVKNDPKGALGHNFVEKTITQNPTCAAEGFTKTVKVCSRCNTPDPTYTEKVAPIAVVKHTNEAKVYEWFGWEGNYPLTNDEAKEIAGKGFKTTKDAYTNTYVVDDKNVVKYTLTYDLVKPVCGVSGGTATVTCDLCKMERTVIIEKQDHVFVHSEWIERPHYAQDCTVAGQRAEECAICGFEREVEVPAQLDHNYHIRYVQKINNSDLLRDEHGNVKAYQDVPGYGVWVEYETDDYVLIATESLKCLYPCTPYTIVTECKHNGGWQHEGIEDLGCRYYKEETKAALNADKHVFADEPTFDIPATCSAEGHWLYNCAVCGETKDVKFEKLPHTWEVKKNVAATCTTAGTIEKACKKCDATDTQTIAATGHNLVVETKAATCYATGLKTTTCTKCGEVKTEVLPIAHKAPVYDYEYVAQSKLWPEGYTNLQLPTCKEAGICSYECVLCGAKVLDEVIPALKHTFGAYTKVEATCGNGAFEWAKCSVCGIYTKKDIIAEPAVDHKKVTEVASYNVITPATCTEDGVASYKCDCTYYVFSEKTGVASKTCGKQFNDAVIAKLGHKYYSSWNPDTNEYELLCIRCEGAQDIEPENAKYTASIEGKKLTIKVEDKNAKLYDKVYARVSVGKKIGDINYAVVYVVEIDWANGYWGEMGTATLAQIQGAGETTGTSVILTTDVNSDDLTFAEALKGNIGSLIK